MYTANTETNNMIEKHLRIRVNIKRTTQIDRETCLVELTTEEEQIRVAQNQIRLKYVKSAKMYITEDLAKRL